MFEPTQDEILSAGDLLQDLLTQGRKALRSKEGQRTRIQEQLAESAARSALAAQRALDRMQWRPRASVALINRCICDTCHTETRVFAGFGVSMFRNMDGAERLVMTPMLDNGFKHETHYTDTVTPACIACVQAMGFTLEEPSHG